MQSTNGNAVDLLQQLQRRNYNFLLCFYSHMTDRFRVYAGQMLYSYKMPHLHL